MRLANSAPVSSALVACSLLLGIVLAPSGLAGHRWLLPLSMLLALAGACRRIASPRIAALLLLSAALILGLARGAEDRAAVSARSACLPPGGVDAEQHWHGVVLAAAEPAADGERLLRLFVESESRDTTACGLRVLLRVAPPRDGSDDRIDTLAAGDRLRLWARIRRPRRSGNPGDRDPVARLRAQGLDAVGSVKSAELVELLASGADGTKRAAEQARRWARQRLHRALASSEAARSLLVAMVLGDRAALTEERQRILRRAGLAHMVAISGLHVGFVLWGVHALLGRWFGARGWMRWAISIVLLSGFALAVGGRSSVWRAVLVAAVWLGGRCLGREGTAMRHLMLVAALLAWVRPWSPTSPGYQLTFLAVAGILRFRRPIQDLLPLPHALSLGPAVGAAAYLATAPAVAWHFGWLAPVGLLSNLAALPLCACALGCGFALIALEGVPACGWLAASACERVSAALWWVAESAAAFDPGAFAVASPPTTVVALYYALLVAVAVNGSGATIRRLGAASLGLLLVWVHLGAPPPAPTGRTEIRVIDVGQGLAVALRGPRGGVVLFDTGGSPAGRFDPGERIVAPFLLRWSGRRVDALVLSHGDVDHAGGARAVLEALEVGQLWLGPNRRSSPLLAQLVEVARKRGTVPVVAGRGRSLCVGGIPFRVLGPHRGWDGPGTNDGSLVLLAGTRPCRLLLTGDLEAAGEAELLASGEPLRSEALIVAHHGSRSATGFAFLDRVRPDWAIVAAGFRNRFGHPHPDVLRRLSEAGVAVLRTDLDGALSLYSSPAGWTVESFRPRDGRALKTPASGPE